MRFFNVGTRLLFAKLKPAVASYFDIEIEILVLYFNMTALWTAHPDCLEHVKIELKTRVRSFPPSFLLAPVDGEVFDNADMCQERLQGWALSQGFAVIRTSGSLKQKRPRFKFRYIYYGAETSDTHKLKEHVKRDKEDRIISHHKQKATNINAHSYYYLITLTHKQVKKRGSGVYGLVLRVSNDAHSHTMAVNALRYKKEHIKTLPGFLPTLELDKSL